MEHDTDEQTNDTFTFPEKVLKSSRLSDENGSIMTNKEMSSKSKDVQSCKQYIPPNGAQKWWAAILIGLLAGIIFSPIAYDVTSGASTYFKGPRTGSGNSNFLGLVVHTLIFIVIIRVLLW